MSILTWPTEYTELLFRFDGDFAEDSGYNRYPNSIGSTLSFQGGKVNNCLYINGLSTSYLQLPAFNRTQDFSITCVYAGTDADARSAILSHLAVAVGDPYNAYWGWSFELQNGYPALGFQNGAMAGDIFYCWAGTKKVNDGDLHLLGVTHTASEVILFVDGVETGCYAHSHGMDLTGHVWNPQIGRAWYYNPTPYRFELGCYLKGLLDELHLQSKVMSHADMMNLYLLYEEEL